MDTTTTSAVGHPRKAVTVALVAGVAFAVSSLGSAVLDEVWVLMLVGFALLVYAVPALHRHQAPADGPLGRWGSRLVVLGAALVLTLAIVFLIWEAIGTPPEDAAAINALWVVGFFSFVIGVVLFSAGTLRAGVFPRGAAALMLGGLLGALAIDMATGAFFEDDGGGTTEWGFYIGVPLFGLGLAWIGYFLRSHARGPTATTRMTAPTA